MNFLRDISTENNDRWFCPVRVASLLAVLTFLFLEVYEVVVRHHDFDAVAFGGAFVAIIGAMTGAITAKGKMIEGDPE